jgi:hypothetical protein
MYSVLRPNNRQQFTSRFDYSISDKTNSTYVSLANMKSRATRGCGGTRRTTNAGQALGPRPFVVINLTNVVNPSMTNEILFSASKLH